MKDNLQPAATFALALAIASLPFTPPIASAEELQSSAACESELRSAEAKKYKPVTGNYRESSKSQGSFFIDASSRTDTFNEARFINLLRKSHYKKLGQGRPDATGKVKCMNYFLKRSNVNECVDLAVRIPPASQVEHFPGVRNVYRCSPDKAIYIIEVTENGMNGWFILDPLGKLKIRAADARYQNSDFYASRTGDRHLFSGNLFIVEGLTPRAGQIVPQGSSPETRFFGWKNYEAVRGHGFRDTVGDDSTYIFKGSKFWANIFTISLLNSINGSRSKNLLTPEADIGLTLKMCDPGCLRRIKDSIVAKGIFLKPRGFWANLDSYIENDIPDGIPQVISVAPGSESAKKNILPAMLILKAGEYTSAGRPYAVSIQNFREQIFGKHRIDLRVVTISRAGEPMTEDIGWHRAHFK